MRIALMALMLTLCGQVIHAQGISPLILVLKADKHNHASAEFTVSNKSVRPMVTTLDVEGFSVDASGHATDHALSGTKVALSELSARIAPQSDHVFSFDATCPASEMGCWFRIYSSDRSAQQVVNGVQVRVLLGLTVYIMRDHVRKSDMQFVWESPTTLRINNSSGRLGRVEESHVIYAKKSSELGEFPIFPNSTRVLRFATAPQKAVFHFQGFTAQSQP